MADLVRSRRMIAAPFGDVGLPTIDPDDIGEVAAVALRDGSHAGRVYELTGPERISPRGQAHAIGDVLGTPVRFVELSRDEARTQMRRFMPEEVVEGTLTILGDPSTAEREVSPDVEHVLGRPPRTFAAWAARTIHVFR